MKNLKIFTNNIDENAKEQINELLEQPAFKDSKVRVMPDVHAGKGCVIGFTGDLGEKVIPNIVGVDIGCGIFCANLGKVDIDFEKLDTFITNKIPSGMNVNDTKKAEFNLKELLCYDRLKNLSWIEKSIGSLGGGNHFIEIDEDSFKNKYLVIHSGSRNLGAQVADIYQELANLVCNHNYDEYTNKRNEVIKTYKELGKSNEIESALKKIKEEFEINRQNIKYELSYLCGKHRDDYLHDMKICQEFAVLNRYTMAKSIANYMNFNIDDYFESVHNYISFDDNIVRKGAISAKKGQRVIIPINMRDGCILGVGKGNDDWNSSAPHGAGRIMSRRQAQESIDLEEYKNAMKDIYSTSVVEETKDEAPFVYKGIDEILNNITDTVEVVNIIKPIYNFKAKNITDFKK